MTPRNAKAALERLTTEREMAINLFYKKRHDRALLALEAGVDFLRVIGSDYVDVWIQRIIQRRRG